MKNSLNNENEYLYVFGSRDIIPGTKPEYVKPKSDDGFEISDIISVTEIFPDHDHNTEYDYSYDEDECYYYNYYNNNSVEHIEDIDEEYISMKMT